MTTHQKTLQQRTMSFLSELVNHCAGSWDRDTAYHLVREMLDAKWHEADERCPVGDHCPCQTDTSELHRLIEDGWYKARRLLSPDDSPYHWLKDIQAEWVEIKAGRRSRVEHAGEGRG